LSTHPTIRSRELRATASDAERILWTYLRRKTICGHRFRRQFSLGAYFADFVCLPVRLVVEVDGSQHLEPEQMQHDARRTAWLERNNFEVIRFWAGDVIANVEGVIEIIERVVQEREQFLKYSPSPCGRGQIRAAPAAKNFGEGCGGASPLPRVAPLRAPSREGRGKT
jgi:very-short-patch-repair endonuclease